MLLAIDTSAGTSVAVVDGDRVLSEASDPGTRGHAELIGTLIQRALADAEASPADITGVVSGMGPGPFTGLRVGIAAARAFAAGRGIPVHPVASHDAVAFGSTAPVLVVPTPAAARSRGLRTTPSARTRGAPTSRTPRTWKTAVEGYAGFERIDAAEVSSSDRTGRLPSRRCPPGARPFAALRIQQRGRPREWPQQRVGPSGASAKPRPSLQTN